MTSITQYTNTYPQSRPAAAHTQSASEEKGQFKLPDEAVSNPRTFDLSQTTPVSELPEEDYQMLLDGMQRMLESMHTRIQPGDPRLLEPYAEIVVDGRVIATVDNNGYIGSDVNLRYLGIDMDAISGGNLPKGPERAQVLAEQLARAAGGSVWVRSDTALDQATYDRLEQPRAVVDWLAMQADPYNLNLLKIMQARAEYERHSTAPAVVGKQEGTAG
ncbi:hypothetical protein [Marinobacterium stanieri]|uniref:hypothetical protein n=1 Tax=Marinobacterium stanieri TaxID=49186 RepID=UPI003A940EC7